MSQTADKMLVGAEYDVLELKEMEGLANELARELGSFIIDKFEKRVADQPKKPFVVCDDVIYTYEVVDMLACKLACVAKHHWGLQPRDCVALVLDNDPSFYWIFYGLQKLGVCVALINHNLRSHPLLHSIEAIDCKVIITGPGPLLKAVTEVMPQQSKVPIYALGTALQTLPKGVGSLDELMHNTYPTAISPAFRAGITMEDTCCYIYTSGTTGKPKPVIMSHAKGIFVSVAGRYTGSLTKEDILYCALPLYHNTGCFVASGSTMLAGATLILKRKFSARHFWDDCRRYKVTAIPYIGELLRYLLSVPKTELDGIHTVRVLFGAGFRADIWNELLQRFKIPKVVEFYGVTEGHAVFVNWASKPGSIGRLSPLLRKFDSHDRVLVKFDMATTLPLRDRNGRCIPVKTGEPGLFLSKVPEHLLNKKLYKAPAEATEKKLVRNAFAPGDVYMNYGDALVRDEDHFVYFYDRLGDTFRWKGENVSTKEVADALSTLHFIEDANVYGVEIPGKDGKAGMASLTLIGRSTLGNKELSDLYHHVCKELPSYARPLLIRLLPEAVITGTFKNKKVELAQEGYDLNKVKDPLYFFDQDNKTYSPFGKDILAKFMKAKL